MIKLKINMTNKPTVAVAMSGGVDSSTTAALLKEQGYRVIGITMRLYTGFSTCCGLSDVEDARKVAEVMGFPFHVISFEKEFSSYVIDRFVSDYLHGRTPNPCVLCNQSLKFDYLLQKARELGADYLATGHYAQITHDDQTGQYHLCKAVDIQKDQSYFLFSVTQPLLARLMFPLGGMTKEQTRELSRQLKLPVHDKSESQDICFVSQGRYPEFVESWINYRKEFNQQDIPTKGDFVDIQGKVLGQHKGIHYYTVGQRSRLGIALGKPVYVAEIKADKNQVVLGDVDDLMRSACRVSDVNWISGVSPVKPLEAVVKIRYRHEGALACLYPEKEGLVRIEFKTPQRAITPGQAAVFYDGEIVVGGGWISEVIKPQ